MLSLHLYSGGSGCPRSWGRCRHWALCWRDGHGAKRSARHLPRMACTVCTGSARCLGWSWLAVSKHFFGIYLPEILQCKALVRASPSAGSHRGPNRHTQTRPEQTLILGRGAFCPGSVQRSEVHIYSISQEQADDAKGCPTCSCCSLWILFSILTCHLDPLSHAGGNLRNDTLC